jgi:DNA (cytosine-5)-methyltransferase 1
LGEVLSALAEIGFDAEWHSVQAAAVGAPHKRERVFIVAYRRGERLQRKRKGRATQRAVRRMGAKPTGLGSVSMLRRIRLHKVFPFARVGMSMPCHRRPGRIREFQYGPLFGSDLWSPYTGPIRMANGVPRRVDRLRCLGNAIVPQVAEVVADRLLEIIDEQNAKPAIQR